MRKDKGVAKKPSKSVEHSEGKMWIRIISADFFFFLLPAHSFLFVQSKNSTGMGHPRPHISRVHACSYVFI